MAITYRDGVAILEVIVYTLFAPLAIILARRHGFGRSAGWYFLILFTLVRLVGGILQLVGSQSHPVDVNALIGAAVCNSIGLSPLNLLLLGFLSRANDSISDGQGKLPPKLFKLIAVVSLVGIILSATGGSKTSTKDNGDTNIPTSSKAGTIIFFAIFIIQAGLTGYLGMLSRAIAQGERRLVLTVAGSVPFMLVRYAYTLRYVFTGHRAWSSVKGNITLYLFMSVLMELVVAAGCIAVGLTLAKRPPQSQDDVKDAEQLDAMSPDAYAPRRSERRG